MTPKSNLSLLLNPRIAREYFRARRNYRRELAKIFWSYVRLRLPYSRF